MSEVELKIEEVLEGTQDPFFLVFDRENDGTTKFYESNKEKIKSVIEEIIQNRKINLKQLYDLSIVYFEDKLITRQEENLELMQNLIRMSNVNSKTLRLLEIFTAMCKNDPDTLENHIDELSILLGN